MMKTENKNLKGYSLLELLVTLVVFAILMTMIVQVLLLSIESGRKVAARSKVRGDLSEVAVMIRRDIRNAGKIDETNCGQMVTYSTLSGQNVVNNSSACFFNIAGTDYAWVYGIDSAQPLCPEGKMCKLREAADGSYQLFYQSSDILSLDPSSTRFELDVRLQEDDSITQGIFLALLAAKPSAESNLNEVEVQYRQISVFTRNF